VNGSAARQAAGDQGRRADASVKAEIDAARERMRGLGFGCDQIAAELGRRYKLRPRKAYRIAYGWTQQEAAARLNARAAEQGSDPNGQASLTGSHLCDHEQWPYGGRRPSMSLLMLMATVYGTNVANLLDLADHQHLPPGDRLILHHSAHPDTRSQPAAGYSPFGDELVRLLADRSVSQRKIARQVPCDTGYLSKLIHGHKPPTRNIAARLEELLDADGRLLAHVPERETSAKRGRTPHTATHGPQQHAGTGGISVTLPCVPGRLVIEVSGLQPAASTNPDSRHGHALRLIPPPQGTADAAG
jgi:transcriptional regulator with XRE-family HTH domain